MYVYICDLMLIDPSPPPPITQLNPHRQAWEPVRQDYLQFLVDSKLVYETFDEIVNGDARLAPFRNTGACVDVGWLGMGSVLGCIRRSI